MIYVTAHGRLVRDPETRAAGNSTVCGFTLASDKRKRDDGADFLDCNAWNKTGEIVQKYFQKGKDIVVQGELQSRKYTDKDGHNRVAWSLNVQNVEFCSSKSDNSVDVPYSAPSALSLSQGSGDDFAVVDDNEDLPF